MSKICDMVRNGKAVFLTRQVNRVYLVKTRVISYHPGGCMNNGFEWEKKGSRKKLGIIIMERGMKSGVRVSTNICTKLNVENLVMVPKVCTTKMSIKC
jgi:hypothetical protein